MKKIQKPELGLVEDTLDEAAKLQEAVSEIDLLIERIGEIKTGIAARVKEIIDLHVESGQLEEGLFRLILSQRKKTGKSTSRKSRSSIRISLTYS